jgi:hypothetical protein
LAGINVAACLFITGFRTTLATESIAGGTIALPITIRLLIYTRSLFVILPAFFYPSNTRVIIITCFSKGQRFGFKAGRTITGEFNPRSSVVNAHTWLIFVGEAESGWGCTATRVLFLTRINFCARFVIISTVGEAFLAVTCVTALRLDASRGSGGLLANLVRIRVILALIAFAVVWMTAVGRVYRHRIAFPITTFIAFLTVTFVRIRRGIEVHTLTVHAAPFIGHLAIVFSIRITGFNFFTHIIVVAIFGELISRCTVASVTTGLVDAQIVGPGFL